MSDCDLWKYFTKEHHKEFVLSLGLLGNTDRPPEKQLACLYAVSNNTEHHYTRLEILKRNGSIRDLLSPDPLLKRIQRNILRNVLEKLSVSPHATAYRKGVGILGNASPHQRQRLILKMDICDFFGSITYLMVYRSTFPQTYYPPSVATLLAHLCCYQDWGSDLGGRFESGDEAVRRLYGEMVRRMQYRLYSLLRRHDLFGRF